MVSWSFAVNDCPLTLAAIGHPEVCKLLEAMLAELVRVRVKQRCEAEPNPQRVFEIDGAIV